MGAVKPAVTKAADLREALDKDARTHHLLNDGDLVGRLGAIVILYAPGGEWWEWRQLNKTVWPGIALRGRALARALAEVERLMRTRPVDTLLKWTDGGEVAGLRSPIWNPKMRAAGGYGPWLEALAELRGHAENFASLKMDRGRGRPPDAWRDRFCREVAEALVQAGQKTTKSRDGVFARVLTVALTVAEGAAPEDVFPLVSRALSASRVW